MRRWWALVPAVAAASAVVFAVSTSTATSALATWTAVPTKPSSQVAAAAASSCKESAPAEAAPTIIEQRGTVAMVLLVDQSWTAACVWSDVDQSSVAGSIEELGPSPTGGDVTITTQLSTWSDVDGAWTAIHGRVGPDVAEVVVTRDSGEPVTATVDGGRFAAWWPGNAAAASVAPYGVDGTALPVALAGR